MLNRKKILSLCLAGTMIITANILPQGKKVDAAKIYSSGDYTYQKLEDGTVRLCAYAGTGTSVTIPSEIDGYAVSVIGSQTFGANRNEQVEEVIISEPVKKIEDMAFYGCDNLKQITIPKSVIQIGEVKYGGISTLCFELQNITVADDNPKYSSVSGVLLNKDKSALLECPEGKKEYTIPETVKKVKKEAFYECNKLEKLSGGKNIEIIEERAFLFCKSLKKISFGKRLKQVGSKAFMECGALKAVTLGKQLKKISAYSFYGCKSLKKIKIPEEVKRIEESAFSECDSIQKITIPAKCKFVDATFVQQADKLSLIKVASENKKYTSVSGVLYDKAKTKLIAFPKARKFCKIPKSVKVIGKKAFFGCNNLKQITIPKSVKEIGKWAFFGCNNLKQITIPQNVEIIGDKAFFKCNKLKKITICSPNIKYIGISAFYGIPKKDKVKFTFCGVSKKTVSIYKEQIEKARELV